MAYQQKRVEFTFRGITIHLFNNRDSGAVYLGVDGDEGCLIVAVLPENIAEVQQLGFPISEVPIPDAEVEDLGELVK